MSTASHNCNAEYATKVGLLNGALRILLAALLVFAPAVTQAEDNAAELALHWLSAPTATPAVAAPQQAVAFSAQASAEAECTWDFGDGSTGNGAHVTHAYASLGTYLATVTAKGATGACSGSVTVVVAGIPASPAVTNVSSRLKRAPRIDPSYAMELAPLDNPSVAPFTRLSLTVAGLTSDAYTTVRFTSKQQTFEVAGANIGGTVVVSVPPFVSNKKFARATVLMQVVQGAKVSNPVKVAIADLPKVAAAPGRYSYSFLRTFRTMTRTARTELAGGSYGTTSKLADVDELIDQYASMMSYVAGVGNSAADGTLSPEQKKFDLPVVIELDRLIAGLLQAIGAQSEGVVGQACQSWLAALATGDADTLTGAELAFRNAVTTAFKSGGVITDRSTGTTTSTTSSTTNQSQQALVQKEAGGLGLVAGAFYAGAAILGAVGLKAIAIGSTVLGGFCLVAGAAALGVKAMVHEEAGRKLNDAEQRELGRLYSQAYRDFVKEHGPSLTVKDVAISGIKLINPPVGELAEAIDAAAQRISQTLQDVGRIAGYRLTIVRGGVGHVTGTGGIDTKKSLDYYVTANTSVTLTAIAGTLETFDKWSGDASGSATSVTIKMDGAKTVTANFKASGLSDITVGGRNISVWLRDYDRADGDLVTLTLNGTVVLSSYSLTNTARYVNLALQPGRNFLKIQAINVGDPAVFSDGTHNVNTAEMGFSGVTTGTATQRYSLNAGEENLMLITAP